MPRSFEAKSPKRLKAFESPGSQDAEGKRLACPAKGSQGPKPLIQGDRHLTPEASKAKGSNVQDLEGQRDQRHKPPEASKKAHGLWGPSFG